MTFIVLQGRIVGSEAAGFDTVYGWDSEQFEDRRAAISHGMRLAGSDDFNIGRVEGDWLIGLDWMEEVLAEDHRTLAKIAKQVGLRARP